MLRGRVGVRFTHVPSNRESQLVAAVLARAGISLHTQRRRGSKRLVLRVPMADVSKARALLSDAEPQGWVVESSNWRIFSLAALFGGAILTLSKEERRA